jgi:pimeloyl-ACP methyl ester carboxylesterase
MMCVMSTVISKDGTRIGYDRFGDGPTVVFVAGATQFRALDPNTTQTARLLADQGYTAVTYDRRGRGESTDTAPWALAREAEDLGALIDAVGGPAVPLTSSSGAAVALAAVSAGADIRALALYEPPFLRIDHTEQIAHLRALLAGGEHEAALRYNLASIIGIPADAIADMARSPWWPTMVAVAPTLPYDITAVQEINDDPDWPVRWAHITVPTIVYSGDQTFPGLPEAADAVAKALPNATRRVLPGQSHGPAAEAMVPPLVEFLRSL